MSECNKIRNGECHTLNCLLRGGWEKGQGHSKSTCIEFEHGQMVEEIAKLRAENAELKVSLASADREIERLRLMLSMLKDLES